MSELADIRHALETARRMGCDEVELEVDGVSFAARLGQVGAPMPTVAESRAAAAAEIAKPSGATIAASCVGYLAKVAVQVGDEVSAGQVVASITGLGLTNEVESTVSGVVAEILAREGQPVEFGQPLFALEARS